MKTNILLTVLIGINFGLLAQVTDTGDKVGIGTTSPLTKLTISGVDSQSWGSGIGLLRSGVDGRILVDTDGMKFRNMNSGKNFFFRNSSNQTTVFIKDNGNVGIGTSSPSSNLHVDGNDTRIKVTHQDNAAGLSIGQWDYINNRIESWGRELLITNYYGNTYFGSSGNKQLTLTQSGNIGIGTTNPLTKLTINGADSQSWGSGIGLLRSGVDGRILVDTDGMKFRNMNSGKNFIFRNSSNQTTVFIKDNGNIGIGTTNPNSWKLAVNGNIRAKEIKVETGWSDFVFENNYKLPTLKEVENHIKEKGHLKNIPSAKEVEKNGIFLGEMNSKLLQKIEELTLYTIQQEKRLDNLESKNEKLEEENKALKTLNSKLLEVQKRLEKLEQK